MLKDSIVVSLICESKKQLKLIETVESSFQGLGGGEQSSLDGITHSLDMNLSKLWKIVEDRGTCF